MSRTHWVDARMSVVSIPPILDWTAVAADSPYPAEAFAFVQEGLGYTSDLMIGDRFGLEELDRHVTGQQLCLGLRDFAIEQYGLRAPVVLRQWGVHRTDDFGAIVYHMVDHGHLRTSMQDSPDDFRAVFVFDEAFHRQELVDRIGVDR